MDNLVDIISFIINSIDLNLKVERIEGNRIYVCNTIHATLGQKVKDSEGNEYIIDDFSINEWIEVSPLGHSLIFAGEIVVLKPITFLHGDPKSTNSEYLNKTNKTTDKTPFVWLVESYTYDDLPRDSALYFDFQVRLFFLDWAETEKWENKDHNERVVKPMANLQKSFLKVIEDDYNFKRLERVKMTVRNRFGVNPQNPERHIIDEELSGIEMNFKLEVYDVEHCSC